MDYESICSSVFDIDPKIRSAAIYHRSGQLLCGGMRDGVFSFLPREERVRSVQHAIMRWETRRALYPFIGQGRYSMTEYEKVKRITFPLNQGTFLLVTTEVSANHNFIIDKIQQVLNQESD